MNAQFIIWKQTALRQLLYPDLWIKQGIQLVPFVIFKESQLIVTNDPANPVPEVMFCDLIMLLHHV